MLQTIYDRFNHLRQYLNWSIEDDKHISQIRALLLPFAPVFIEDFYAEIVRHPTIARVITGGDQQIARLKQSLFNWITDLFSGRYDAEYVLRRWKVGYRHVEIGLDQTYVNIAHALLLMQMQGILLEELKKVPNQLRDCEITLHKLLDLDLALISAAYAAELQERQQKQAKQDERLATIGQMITGLAHEARNALQRLRASTESLELDLEDQPALHPDLHRLSVAQDDLTRLFTEVQNYAAPLVLERERVVVGHIAQQAWESLDRQRQGRDTQLRLNIPDDLNHGYYDAFRLQQVFRNFFENSLAACKDPVVLEITAQHHDIDGQSFIEFRVQDNGPGLSESARLHVFDPFFTTKTKGTGLGMAIALRIVDAHGGRLQLGPIESTGADFRLLLPRVEHVPSAKDRHRG
jgi:signal transduction histidine kinase